MAKKTAPKTEAPGRGGARKGAGRPSTLDDAQFIGLRLSGSMVERIDAWRDARSEKTDRSSAIRNLTETGLKTDGF
jgi:hypothetical protein